MSSITDDVQHFVRNPLDEITSKFERACIPYNFVTLESINMDTSDLKVILDPLDFLLNSFTVYALFKAVPSTSNRNMVARINSLRNRINSKSINPKHLKPLVRSIFSKAADTEVWFQLISVLDIFEPHSTSDTFTSSLNYPDVCHRQTAAPYKGKDQKVEILKEALRTELNGTIFEDVGGFYEKYFEMTPWANQCQTIADSFVNRKFKARFRFPKKPTESNVWRWVHRIQTEFIESYKAPTVTPSDKSASSKKEKTFPQRSNKFRTTSAWQFEASESPRQVDFFFKSRKHAAGTPHDWRDVLVLGELTLSSVGVWKSKFLQLSVYMREVFMAQPLRRFVHGFLLFGTKLQLWVFDRSGPMSTGFIDIGENPEKLIYVITAYMLLSDNELGLDSNFVQEHDRTLIKVKEPETDNWLMLTLEPFPFIVQRSIVSRGTTVYRGLYESFVVKISWRAVGRMSEVELLGKSRSIRGVATLIGSLDMEKISELRDGLTFTKAMQREIQADEEPMTTPHDLLQPETSNQEGIVQPSGGVKRKSASSAGDSQQSKRSCVSSISRQARTNAAVASVRKGGTSASKRAPGKLTALKNSTPTINQSLNQGSTSSGSKRSRNDGEMNVDAPNVPERELKKLRITSSTGGPLPEASAGPLPASNATDATVLDVPDVVVVDVNASPKISNMSTIESSLFYRDRLQSIIASKPSGRAIGEDTSPLDLLCGLRDAIKGHRSLFLDARILHRDISVNNIILTDPKSNDGCCGVLIDLDLAMSLDDPNAAASSHILTGTMEFMALGILRANLTRTSAGIKHSYRHDLESFFYVLVSTSMRFGWGDKKATHLGLLGTWYKGTVYSMYNAKFTAIHVDSFESNVLSGFSAKFECLKDVAKKMRASLFDRGCGFWLGEDHHPETLYNPILLDVNSEIAKMECDYA